MRKWFTFNIFAIDNEADRGIVIMYAIDGIFPSVAQNFMHFGRFPRPDDLKSSTLYDGQSVTNSLAHTASNVTNAHKMTDDLDRKC